MTDGIHQVRPPIPALLFLLAIQPALAQADNADDPPLRCGDTSVVWDCQDAATAPTSGAQPEPTAAVAPEATSAAASALGGGTPSPRRNGRREPAGLTPTPRPRPADVEVIPTAPTLPLPAQLEEAMTRSEPLRAADLVELAAPAQAPPASPYAGDAGAPSVVPVPSFDEVMLYDGLTWDFCGPRAGGTGIGSPGPSTDDQERPVDVGADRADYDRVMDVVTLDGDIVIVQGAQQMLADHSIYDRISGDVTAPGRLYVEQPGARLVAGSGRFNLNTKEGRLADVSFRMSGDTNLRGTAATAQLLPRSQTRYSDATYTTCAPGRSDWSIKASDLLLDHEEGLGTARHARIRIGDVPVFYTPWMRFPIDDRRRSGFLVPTVGTSDRTGTDITVPYYWNIAPNMDATFFPRVMSSRGVALGVEVRHKTGFQDLGVYGEVLPHDAKAEDLGTRGAFQLEQTGRFGANWTSSIELNAVSDDDYLTDFGNTLEVTSLRNLTQRGDLRYTGNAVEFLFRIQDFQTVDPDLPERAYPYAQLPHMELTVEPVKWRGLEWQLDARFDYFAHDVKVQGNRLVLLPAARLPIRRSYGYLIPRARLYYTGYALDNQDEGDPAQLSHLIPSLDIDGKLIFERQTHWLGDDVLQTLEPRLYYVYAPYEDQTDNPLFDTSTLSFSYASLFQANRFTGYDRIGDENRLTLGITSRSLDSQSGHELFHLSIGQILYFNDRRVRLSTSEPAIDRTSSVAGEIAANITKDLVASASLQWNPQATEDAWEKRVLQLRYDPADDRVLNLAYRYNQGTTTALSYEDADLSFRMPVTGNLQVVGRWLYSILNTDTVEAFAGIEYGRCCWRIRVLGRHLKLTGQDEGSTSVMLQLELAGLGAIGDSIDAFLEQGIYGYESTY